MCSSVMRTPIASGCFRLCVRRCRRSALTCGSMIARSRRSSPLEFPRFRGHLTAARFGAAGGCLSMPKSPPYSPEFRVRPCSCSAPAAGRSRCWPRSSVCHRSRSGTGPRSATSTKAGRRPEQRRARRAAPVAPRGQGPRGGARDPEKSRGLLRLGEQDPVTVFGFVLARKAEHSIALMCRVLEVCGSGYHAWAAGR